MVPNGATLTLDPDAHTAHLQVYCTRAWADSCIFSINEQTIWSLDFSLVCAPGDTVCLDGDAITCDAAGTVLSDVACGAPCDPCGLPTPDRCGDTCVNFNQDVDDCGGCGVACPGGQLCDWGTCTCPAATPDPCSVDGVEYCTDLQFSPGNCGECGRACPAGFACVTTTCACPWPNTDECWPDAGAPYCTLFASDAANCGGCGHACEPGQSCSSGGCVP